MLAGGTRSCEPWTFASAKTWLTLLSALALISASWGLRLTKVTIPIYRLRGEMALLECVYELEGDRLYSVKWYKDNEEFYRYVPKANPPQHSYKVEGIRVDHHLSDSVQIFLRSVTLKSSGIYKCEVSAEAPSFASVSGEGRMEVVFPPKEPPRITGGKFGYEWNEWVDLNCTAGKSFPPAAVRWFVSDQPVVKEWLVPRESLVYGPHGLISTVQGLRFRTRPEQFREPGPGGGGESSDRSGETSVGDVRSMRLKCVAVISALYWEGGGGEGGGGGSPGGESAAARARPKGAVAAATPADGPDASPALSPVIDRRESDFVVYASSSGASWGISAYAVLMSSLLVFSSTQRR
ncbi:uncharacterized protein LOC124156237 [Ischnura elegans]|uniref:uncharacterized protein LOC124156237 n=1 Tax=Ischnura elegans TaxID=197161 RepID=UPI001ED86754|nr:uncharacterized protein LOC124156237 [Ischnura elegans]